MFKVVLGWFGALPIFSKIRFSKHYYFYKLQPKFSKFLLKLLLYLPNDLCQTTLMSFWKFENWKFSVFFFVFTNMGLNGSENFRTLLLLQITAESFQTFPEFSSHILLTFTLFRVVCSCCLLFRLYFSEWLFQVLQYIQAASTSSFQLQRAEAGPGIWSGTTVRPGIPGQIHSTCLYVTTWLPRAGKQHTR